MSKSPWGNIGAWAADSERAEAEEQEAAAKAAADVAVAPPQTSFPSLKEAVNTTKQKKKTKMTLQEFTMQPSSYSGSVTSRGLTPEEMLRLPTGPRERSPDEMQHGRLGGGFANYGSRTGSGGSNAGRGRDYEGRRSHGFEEDNRRGPPPQSRVSEFNQPSRADEVDNWASMKKQTLPEYDSHHRAGGKYSSLGGGGSLGVSSRADEVDNWAAVKKPISQTQHARSSNFGSGFSRPEPDRWARNEQSFGSGFSRPEPDRWTLNEQRLVLETAKNDVEVAPKVNKPNPFGAARPREEVLAEKGLDWKKMDLEIEVNKQHSVSGGSRPTSSQSSRPGSAHSSRSEAPAALTGGGEGIVKQKPKVNPFGGAKPREVLLEEKGLDWKKIDLELEHRQVQRPETEQEKNLKDEIEHLRKELLEKCGEDQTSIHDLIARKERELEVLVRQLDDKVRYSQKVFERQGAGAIRGAGFNDRPPSRPGSYDGFHDRPTSAPGQYEEPGAGHAERPPSQPGRHEDSGPPSRPGAYEDPRSKPGAYEESRAIYPQRSSFTHGAYQEPRASGYNERPHSRGSVNSWTRLSDDSRSFQGGGGRGFSGSRDMERSGSRW